MSSFRIVYVRGAAPNEVGPTRSRNATADQSVDETRTPASRSLLSTRPCRLPPLDLVFGWSDGLHLSTYPSCTYFRQRGGGPGGQVTVSQGRAAIESVCSTMLR